MLEVHLQWIDACKRRKTCHTHTHTHTHTYTHITCPPVLETCHLATCCTGLYYTGIVRHGRRGEGEDTGATGGQYCAVLVLVLVLYSM